MNEPDSLDVRIGDAEREEAFAALGEHMSAGRLAIDEYGDRSAKVAAARTRNDLVVLFTDLPAPRPPSAPLPRLSSLGPGLQLRCSGRAGVDPPRTHGSDHRRDLGERDLHRSRARPELAVRRGDRGFDHPWLPDPQGQVWRPPPTARRPARTPQDPRRDAGTAA
ncbi:MAG: DUF1707 domain-containing protein [Pseudonocardiales bacterium]|nr:DUF1707 domain-containing protein [Pseudonocardiales bacterium]